MPYRHFPYSVFNAGTSERKQRPSCCSWSPVLITKRPAREREMAKCARLLMRHVGGHLTCSFLQVPEGHREGCQGHVGLDRRIWYHKGAQHCIWCTVTVACSAPLCQHNFEEVRGHCHHARRLPCRQQPACSGTRSIIVGHVAACMVALSIRRVRPAPHVKHHCCRDCPSPPAQRWRSALHRHHALQAAVSLSRHEKALKGMTACMGTLAITRMPSTASRDYPYRLQRPSLTGEHHFAEVCGHRHNARRLLCRRQPAIHETGASAEHLD